MSNSTTEATRKRVKLRRLEETDEKELKPAINLRKLRQKFIF
jgi:hypothetical protein